jgi:hypothetical protein
MADGDVTIKTLYSSAIGGGHDTSGNPKQSKRLVVGQIDGTYHSTGLSINKHGGPQAFGVNNLDYLFLEVITIAATESTTNALQTADYDHANQKIFLCEDLGAATPAVPSNADVVVLRFVAFGDDPTTPDLG